MKPPEQVRQEFLRRWLEKADEDLGVAHHLLATDALYLGAVGFHAQQAAGEYLKALEPVALLTARDVFCRPPGAGQGVVSDVAGVRMGFYRCMVTFEPCVETVRALE